MDFRTPGVGSATRSTRPRGPPVYQTDRTAQTTTTTLLDVANTARYLARSLREGHNDIGEALDALADWEAEQPGALRAAASPTLTGTTDDLAMALIFEAAATAHR